MNDFVLDQGAALYQRHTRNLAGSPAVAPVDQHHHVVDFGFDHRGGALPATPKIRTGGPRWAVSGQRELGLLFHRRHLTKGQRAMAVAMISPEPEDAHESGKKGGRGKKGLGDRTVSRERLSLARTVIEHAPELCGNVLSGSMSLDKAYETASNRRDGADGEVIRLATLRENYPELADKVVEGDLTLPAGASKRRIKL